MGAKWRWCVLHYIPSNNICYFRRCNISKTSEETGYCGGKKARGQAVGQLSHRFVTEVSPLESLYTALTGKSASHMSGLTASGLLSGKPQLEHFFCHKFGMPLPKFCYGGSNMAAVFWSAIEACKGQELKYMTDMSTACAQSHKALSAQWLEKSVG